MFLTTVSTSYAPAQAFDSTASVRFSRFVNTTLLTGKISLDRELGGIGVRFIEGFRSSVVASGQRFVQDNQSFSLLLRAPVAPSLSAVLEASSTIAADNRQLALSNVSNTLLRAGFEYRPLSWFSILPAAGLRWDQQLGTRDQGPSYSLTMELQEIMTQGYLLHGDLRYNDDFIKPRRWSTSAAQFDIGKDFGAAADRFHVQFLRMNREFYFPADSFVTTGFSIRNNIESRLENAVTASDTLFTALGSSTKLTFSGLVANRSVVRDIRYRLLQSAPSNLFPTEVQEFRLQGGAGISFIESRMDGLLELTYLERDETHSVQPNAQFPRPLYDLHSAEESRKDNNTQQARLSGRIGIHLGAATRFVLEGFQNSLRYDTPSEENIEDRDELMTYLNAALFHQFNSTFSVELPVAVFLLHTVYLNSERSANNNWNRVFKFRPAVTARLADGILNRAAGEVLANYTVYDFENLGISMKSYLFRQMTVSDSVAAELSPTVSLLGFGQLRRYEQGQFNWNSFTEIQTGDVLEKLWVLELHAQIYETVEAGLGYRYFSRSEERVRGDARTLAAFVRSAGPTAALTVRMPAGTVQCTGWYERQLQTGSEVRTIPSLDLRVEWKW